MPRKIPIEPKILVVLNQTDEAYRQWCINEGKEFAESFLMDTRAQRLGCSVRDLDSMFNYERSLQLADEAILMKLPTWATDPAAYLDWEKINANAKHNEAMLAHDFTEFRKQRMAIQIEGRTKRSATKGRTNRE